MRQLTLVLGTILLTACSSRGGSIDCDYSDGGYDAGSWGWDASIGLGTWQDAGAPPTAKSAIQPTFTETVVASQPPPAISGGTLIVTRDGRHAIAADPDRDEVYGIDLATRTVAYVVHLTPGDEPGRAAEDGSGRIHVALRGGGALVTFDEVSGGSVTRRPVCPAPRGVAWDATSDSVWVACATGELLSLPAAGGAATQSFVVERDLRDVVVAADGSLSISKFRSAEILRLASNGSVARRDTQPAPANHAAHVAWRTLAAPGGNLVVIHQVEETDAIPTNQPSAYGGCGGGGEGPPPPPSNMPTGSDASVDAGACSAGSGANFKGVGCDEQPGAVVSALSVIAPDGTVVTDRMFPGSLPVDVAVSPDGNGFAAIAAGDAFTTTVGNVIWFTACGDFTSAPTVLVGDAPTTFMSSHSSATSAQVTAVAFASSGDLLVQTREPAQLVVLDGKTHAAKTRITLSTVSRRDTGHDVFHTQAGAMIACASCHPEGGDDGHVWMLDGNQRRTPSLRGTVAGTAPYHWPGDQPTLTALIDDVYTSRMAGRMLPADEKGALEGWVQKIPAPPSPSWLDGASVQRGEVIFTDSSVGCAGCHSGPKLTNNQTLNVGTGGSFQVPPLVGVGWRTPVLHNGCANTLTDRFGVCATTGHGNIGALSPANVADLVSYLESL